MSVNHLHVSTWHNARWALKKEMTTNKINAMYRWTHHFPFELRLKTEFSIYELVFNPI